MCWEMKDFFDRSRGGYLVENISVMKRHDHEKG